MAAVAAAFSSRWELAYDVFLSFGGEDTDRNFADHLFAALERNKIFTFRGDSKIGPTVGAEIRNVIESSRGAIVVLSKGYASSPSCLDELAMIMEGATSFGLKVIPVFYYVDPSRDYWEAFAAREEEFEVERVSRWRAALTHVANISGMVRGDGNEAEFIKHIVKEAIDRFGLNNGIFNPRDLVGAESYVATVNSWLQDESSDVKIIQLYGMGGVGKTAIARAVFDLNLDRFERSCFLHRTREASRTHGLHALQQYLLSALHYSRIICNVDEGILQIRDAIWGRKVLIVIDDVEYQYQFNAIIGDQKWLFPGSRIIVTTRDASLLKGLEDCLMLQVGILNAEQSLQLFCLRAFKQYDPPEDYVEPAKIAAGYSCGLPVAAIVLGCLLQGISVEEWYTCLDKLHKVLPRDIHNILRISFDSLDNHDRCLFLDIACFFIGMDKDYVVTITDGCGYYSEDGIQHLIDKCLISINDENILVMHPLHRAMGREIILMESPNPAKRSRLWDEDALYVLNTKGTEYIEGITFSMALIQQNRHARTLSNVTHVEQDPNFNSEPPNHYHCANRSRLGLFYWKSRHGSAENSAAISEEKCLRAKTFAKMKRLKLLELNYVILEGDCRDLPKGLVWLCWRGFPLHLMPVGLPPQNVVVLDLRNSSLTRVWEGNQYLPKLKILNLSHSHSLVSTSDFSGLPCLERLILEDCTKLVEIDESIGGLKRIVLLDLKGCKNLKRIPRSILQLESLNLVLSGCSQLELSMEFEKMASSTVVTEEVRPSVPFADKIANDPMESTCAEARRPTMSPAITSTPQSKHDEFLRSEGEYTGTIFSSCLFTPSAHDVFLCSGSKDSSKNFIDHLHAALVWQGIRTFRDDDNVREYMKIEMQQAIEESKISIIVFSKEYGSSPWCLDKHAMIMERRAIGLIVIPVYYNVDPIELEERTSSYIKAFPDHHNDPEQVRRWRAALMEVMNLAGMNLQNRSEARFIQIIVEKVTTRLKHKFLHVSPYLVGLDSQIAKVNSWLQDESTDSKIIVIYGTVGTGKTTLAKTVYNLNYRSFEGSSFLMDISIESKRRPGGLRYLQTNLLLDILNADSIDIRSIDEGTLRIRDAICHKRVLIVLDDVGDGAEVSAIVGVRKWLSPGSKIIVTTRDVGLLTPHENCRMIKLEPLNDHHSLKLFCSHAFKVHVPPDAYLEQTKRAISYCGGLPLALEVLGSSLRRRTVDEWDHALNKMVEIPNFQILEVLKGSFDCLDDLVKKLFLDIACFLSGMDKNYVVTISDSFGYCPEISIQILIDKCLITVDEKNRIMMHPLLREMGREIVRQESWEFPERRSRLWDHFAFDVLNEDKGTKYIDGLTLNLRMLQEDKHARTFSEIGHGKRHSTANSELLNREHFKKRSKLGLFSWFPTYGAPPNLLTMIDGENLRGEAFGKMTRLKLLQLNYVNLTGKYGDLPKGLAWLDWNRFAMDYIPVDFPLENLAVLDMRNSRLKHLWKQTRFLPKLKILNLSQSHFLVSTPNFNGLPCLERLILENCTKLMEIDESIGSLERLVLLNLRDCKRLKKMPGTIARLNSLEEVVLSGCSQLHLPPELLRELKSMVVVADGIVIDQLQPTHVPGRKPSLLPPGSSLTFLPRSFVCLSLANCKTLGNCGLSIDHITRGPIFRQLNLDFSSILKIPESIHMLNLVTLKSGRFRYPEHSTSKANETSLPSFMAKVIFSCRHCENLVEIGGLFKLQRMRNSDKEIINSLGMVKLECLNNTPVEMANSLTRTKRATPPQILHECGIFTLFLSGSEIPDWYSFLVEGSSFTFDVPFLRDQNILGLNFCAVYAFQEMFDLNNEDCLDFPLVCIQNITKRLSWIYRPTFHEIPGPSQDKQWFSHINLQNQLEPGDQVQVGIMSCGYRVKRFGIHIVCEKEEDNRPISSSSWYQALAGSDGSALRSNWGQFFFHHAWLEEKP